MTLPMCYCGKD